MQNSTSSSIYNWNSLHQKHIFNTILYKFSKTKIVLNCNSCWQLVAQAGNGTEAHMNIAHAHRTAHMAADGAHPFLKCTPHRPYVPPAAWLFHAGCSWVPERCFCLCLLLTLVDVCGTNTPVILLSENVFLPELHQASLWSIQHTALRYISWTRPY